MRKWDSGQMFMALFQKLTQSDVIDRKMLRFMADAAIYNAIALDEAIKQSGLRARNSF